MDGISKAASEVDQLKPKPPTWLEELSRALQVQC